MDKFEGDNINGIVLLVNNPAFNIDTPYEVELFGKPMHSWVSLAFNDSPVQKIVYDNSSDVAATVKPFLNSGSRYTVVLYSDTPLFQRKTLLEILKYVGSHNLNVCRLTRGWVFNTEYLRTCEKVFASKTYYFDEEDFLTASDFKQLALVSDLLRQRILAFHMKNGVYITDPASTFIDGDVVIEKNVTIFQNNTVKGKSVICAGAVLSQGNAVTDSVIGPGARITSSNLISCKIGKDTTVGPYAYIRPETVIGQHCRIGDFVEIKKSVIGDGSKVSHLAYVGDAEIGRDCNIGCGVVFVNYDGKNKFKSIVGDNVFVGSNSNIIAPALLKEGSYVAAGSTITDSVDGGLAIARARQVNKPAWKPPKKIEKMPDNLIN